MENYNITFVLVDLVLLLFGPFESANTRNKAGWIHILCSMHVSCVGVVVCRVGRTPRFLGSVPPCAEVHPGCLLARSAKSAAKSAS